MNEDYNPFQSPELSRPTPSYLVPDGIVRKRGPPFMSGHLRAVCAIVALGIVALLDVAAIGLNCAQYKTIVRVQHGGQIDFDQLVADQRRLAIFRQLELIAVIATVILYLFWIHRAYRNLPALGNPVPSGTPAWAVGSYFVPVVNFFIPYTVMAEIWRYSDPLQLGSFRKSTSRLVGAWWAMFWGPLIPAAGLLFTLVLTPSHLMMDAIEYESLWSIAVPAINLVAAVLAIQLIYSIDKNQQTSHDLIQAQGAVAIP